MRVRSSVVAVTVMILAACGGDATGPKNPITPSLREHILLGGDRVVMVSNTKWNLCENIGQENSFCPGAEAKIRWNGLGLNGSGVGFQMDIIWSPGCTWDVPMGPGICIGQHLEVTFYNQHSFGEHSLLVRKYVLHLD
jgi:hypothetical protein